MTVPTHLINSRLRDSPSWLSVALTAGLNIFFSFFLDLEIFGLTMLEGLPPERDTVTKFAWEKFGYPQFTQYGDSFEVMNKPGPSNVAYTGKTLGLHLDQPIYTNRSGLCKFQLFKSKNSTLPTNSSIVIFHVGIGNLIV